MRKTVVLSANNRATYLDQTQATMYLSMRLTHLSMRLITPLNNFVHV